MPSQCDLDRSRKIKILVALPGLKEIQWEDKHLKQHYLDCGFVEHSVGLAPEWMQSVGYNLQVQQRQYGLKHHDTSTIYAAMGDTLSRVAIEISRDNASFQLWDKAQMVVALSRTKFAKNLIFVRSRQSTVRALVDLLKVGTQWSDYIERLLPLVTINRNTKNQARSMTHSDFPFRLCDITLLQCRA
eukprot:10125156-Ditylum_brightwellii.AAC.1